MSMMRRNNPFCRLTLGTLVAFAAFPLSELHAAGANVHIYTAQRAVNQELDDGAFAREIQSLLQEHFGLYKFAALFPDCPFFMEKRIVRGISTIPSS